MAGNLTFVSLDFAILAYMANLRAMIITKESRCDRDVTNDSMVGASTELIILIEENNGIG